MRVATAELARAFILPCPLEISIPLSVGDLECPQISELSLSNLLASLGQKPFGVLLFLSPSRGLSSSCPDREWSWISAKYKIRISVRCIFRTRAVWVPVCVLGDLLGGSRLEAALAA